MRNISTLFDKYLYIAKLNERTVADVWLEINVWFSYIFAGLTINYFHQLNVVNFVGVFRRTEVPVT